MKRQKRFYREVAVEEIKGGRWALVLDGKAAKTPAGNPLVLPTAALAREIAADWLSLSAEKRPETFGLTRLANTAIDRVGANPNHAIAELLAYARTDLLCYRASGPEGLAERQSSVWDPLLDWMRTRYGVRLITGSQLSPIQQCSDDIDRLVAVLLGLDNFVLTGLVAAANILGSLVLALALSEGRLGVEQAFEAAELDVAYQAETWGEAPEITTGNRVKVNEVSDIAKFFCLNRAVSPNL